MEITEEMQRKFDEQMNGNNPQEKTIEQQHLEERVDKKCKEILEERKLGQTAPRGNVDTTLTVHHKIRVDILFQSVLQFVIQGELKSTTDIQKMFDLGYPRAARIVDQLIENGFVKQTSGKELEPLITMEECREIFAVENKPTNMKKIKMVVEVDELFQEALRYAVERRWISATSIRKRFAISYPRAARLIDEMEAYGFISGSNGAADREVWITMGQYMSIMDI